MPPIPVSKLTELALTRRKLFEKIMQHVATRKIQNHIQATGDRMSVTPVQFGAQLGKQVGKQAFFLPTAVGGYEALTAPSGHRAEGLGRGVVKGTGASLGGIAGAPLGIAGAVALALANPRLGKALFGTTRGQIARIGKNFINQRPLTPSQLNAAQNLSRRGGAAGAMGGGIAGLSITDSMLGKPSWEKKEAAVLSVEKSEDTNKETRRIKWISIQRTIL